MDQPINITVAVRVRPLLPKEIERQALPIVDTPDKTVMNNTARHITITFK